MKWSKEFISYQWVTINIRRLKKKSKTNNKESIQDLKYKDKKLENN
jgi:hypothetical protein